MTSPYLLVYWAEEHSYSNARRSKIIDIDLREIPDDKLISLVTKIRWGKNKYDGTIMNAGTEEEMEQALELLTGGAKQKISNESQVDDSHSQTEQSQRHSQKRSLEDNESQEKVKKRRKNKEAESQSSQQSTLVDGENEEQVKKPRKNKKQQGLELSLDISSVLAVYDKQNNNITTDDSPLPTSSSTDNDGEYWKSQYEKEKERSAKYKNRTKTLQAKIAKLKDSSNVDLGNGVIMNKENLATIRSISFTPSKFARGLMRHLFSDEEIIDRTLFGKKCNANKKKKNKKTGNLMGEEDAKPEIDSKRRDAIILTTVEQFGAGMNETTKELLHSKVNRTLGDFIREITCAYYKTKS